jgi:hypothetical protein
MAKRFFFLLLLLALAGIAIRPASATPVFTLTFNPATYSSSVPDFTIDLMATITNTGTTTIDSVDGESVDFDNPFLTDANFFPLPISSSNPLNPGQSVTFGFFNATFVGIPPGTYPTFVLDASITLDDATGAVATVNSSNLPTLLVTPEPSAFLLMATGAIGLLGMVRRRA